MRELRVQRLRGEPVHRAHRQESPRSGQRPDQQPGDHPRRRIALRPGDPQHDLLQRPDHRQFPAAGRRRDRRGAQCRQPADGALQRSGQRAADQPAARGRHDPLRRPGDAPGNDRRPRLHARLLPLLRPRRRPRGGAQHHPRRRPHDLGQGGVHPRGAGGAGVVGRDGGRRQRADLRADARGDRPRGGAADGDPQRIPAGLLHDPRFQPDDGDHRHRPVLHRHRSAEGVCHHADSRPGAEPVHGRVLLPRDVRSRRAQWLDPAAQHGPDLRRHEVRVRALDEAGDPRLGALHPRRPGRLGPAWAGAVRHRLHRWHECPGGVQARQGPRHRRGPGCGEGAPRHGGELGERRRGVADAVQGRHVAA